MEPTENKTPIEEIIIRKCWKTDCNKVATCQDGSGWEWCDEHVDQEKLNNELTKAVAFYNAEFYRKQVREAIDNVKSHICNFAPDGDKCRECGRKNNSY